MKTIAMYSSTISIATRLLTVLRLAVLFGASLANAKAQYVVNNFGDTGAGSGTSGDLRYCITQANANPGSVIYLVGSGTITLQSRLPLITAAMIIDGSLGNVTVSGNNQNRVFFVDAPGQAVRFNLLNIADGRAIGGAGGLGGGGGGAGMGGALFVNAGNVELFGVNFAGNSAVGGAGGGGTSTGGGGGGGAHGAGGTGTYGGGGGGFGGNGGNGNIGAGGGGGLIGNGGNGWNVSGRGSGGGGGGLTAGGNAQGETGGIGGVAGGNGGSSFPYTPATSGALYGGGGGGGHAMGSDLDSAGKNGGHYGGGGGAGLVQYPAPGAIHGGGSGGDFGGGGGNANLANSSAAGGGGFGGGGGGGAGQDFGGHSARAGAGGFGGGGGGGLIGAIRGLGGAFGGRGGHTNDNDGAGGGGGGGGGGAGLGGAVFVRASNGASLTIAESNFSGNGVTGGSGGAQSSFSQVAEPAGNGKGAGSDLFLLGGTTTLRVSSGMRTMNGSIADAAITGAAGVGSITKTGAGTLILSGANTYAGGTAINEGTIELGGGDALGTVGPVSFGGGTLRFAVNNQNDYSSRFSTAAGQQYRLDTNGISIILDTPLTSAGGSLTKLGAGTLFLTANNTYTGGTTISGGTLQLGGGGTSGSLAGNVTNNGTFIVYRGDAVSLNGVISGTGTLEQRGMDTLTLTGANSYSGGTIVTDGTLGIGHDTALGSGPITMAGGGIRAVSSQRTVGNDLLINGSFSLGRLTNFTGPVTLGADVIITSTNPDAGNAATSTFSGVISGAHHLTFAAGANPIGAIVLAGTNTYSGGTTITGGVVSIGADAALGTGSLTLNGGTLRNTGNIISSRAVTLGAGGGTLEGGGGFLTFNNPLNGPGGLTKTGGNYLTLIGAQTYAGPTSIQGGILKVQDGSLASLSVSIGSGSTLLFSVNGSTAANISGSGALVREFSGTTILTGTATHTGGTTISGGALKIGNGGVNGSLSGNVSNNGTLIFQRSDAATFSGVISGSGAVEQEGTGTIILTGDAAHTGGTTVEAGVLVVNGSISGSATTVESGATLSGSGSVAALTIESGGNLAPGNSSGTLSTGTLDLQSGAHLKLELGGTSAGQSDRVNATGTVNLAGDVQISLFGGFMPQIGDKFFALINDGIDSISGSFSNDDAMQRITVDGATFAVNYADNFGGSGVGNDLSLTMVAIPEPGSVLLLSLGLGVFGLRRRR